MDVLKKPMQSERTPIPNTLKMLSKVMNFESGMTIVVSFVTSNFNYCCQLWHEGAACGATRTHLKNYISYTEL